jgi:hypothetical protein
MNSKATISEIENDMERVCGMKTTRNGLIIILLAVSGITLLVGNANARVAMPERENVQTFVWVTEFVTFITALAIAWFVWRISKRDSKNKKSKRDKS